MELLQPTPSKKQKATLKLLVEGRCSPKAKISAYSA